jgi:hypothetical protein
MERQTESSRSTGSFSQPEARPRGPAPADQKKQPLNVVLASRGDKIFEIPLEVAEKYAVSASRAKELQCSVPHAPEQSDSEVGGRHAVLLASGFVGYHSDWLVGPYIWWQDGNVYVGPHWHPYVNNPLAKDLDDA